MKALDIHAANCHECNKYGYGVKFYFQNDSKAESFLCWEHFRLNTDIMMQAGILPRHLPPTQNTDDTDSARSVQHRPGRLPPRG